MQTAGVAVLLPQCHKLMCLTLVIFTQSCPPVQAPMEGVAVFSAQQLQQLTNPHLVQLCRVRGLDRTGRKSALVQRLCSAAPADANPTQPYPRKRPRPVASSPSTTTFPRSIPSDLLRHVVTFLELRCVCNARGVSKSMCGRLDSRASTKATFRELSFLRSVLPHHLSLTSIHIELPDFGGQGTDVDVIFVSMLRGLRDLCVRNAILSDDILRGLSSLTALQTLDLRNCEGFEDVQALSSLTALQTLDLSYSGVSDVRGLSSLTALQTLKLRDCEFLEDMSGLSSLTALRTLDLSCCEGVADEQFLYSLTGLETLDLSGCFWVDEQTVRGLSMLTALRTLDLSGCEEVVDEQCLSSLTALQTLTMY